MRWLIGELIVDVELLYVVRYALVKAAPLNERIREAIRRYPCDVLVVHRDAEREAPDVRVAEIHEAAAAVTAGPILVPVVPVRMTESWLLLDERAIRVAADNPNGAIDLELPRAARIEQLPDPKAVLREALERASEKRGRRLKMFRSDMASRMARVSELTDSFAPARQLSAFQAFEASFSEAIKPLLARARVSGSE